MKAEKTASLSLPAPPGMMLSFFRDIARAAGFVFGFVGWFFFALSLLQSGQGDSAKVVEVFWCSGCLLMISWLLLRFASGLFPFGRRWFS